MPQKKFPTWVIYLIILLFVFPGAFKFIFSLLFPIVIFTVVYLITQRKDLVEKIKNLASSPKSKNKKNIIDYEKLFNFKNNHSSSNFFTMPKFKLHHGLSLVGLLIVIFIIIDGLVSVPAGHVAVIYDRGRGVLEEELPEGLHLKIPFWQVSTIFTTKKQVFTMAGEFYGILDEDAVRGRSKDGQDVTVDVSVTYQVQGTNAPFLLQEFLTENGYRETIINPAARSIVYDAISKFNALELVSEKRSEFSGLVLESLKEIYGNNKIILHEVFVRNVTFSPEFSRAIEEKQIAEQNIQTAKNRKLEAEQIKEKKIIEAQAEAEAIRLKGETLRQNPQVIQFEFVQKMAPNINWGIMPDGIIPMLNMEGVKEK